MAALVQTIPQQSGTVTVLQTRPSSSSGAFAPSSPLSQSQNPRNSSMSWNPYNTTGNSATYRTGHQVVAPYQFNSTPNLSNSTSMHNRQSGSPHLRPEHRTSSAPSAPQLSASPAHGGLNSRFSYHPAAGSVSSSSNSSVQSYMSKDDSAIPSRQLRAEPPLRPLSTVNIPSSNFMNISSPTVARPSPDRYRRGNRRPDSAAGLPSPLPQTNAPGSVRTAPATMDDSLLQPSTPGTPGSPGSTGSVSDGARRPGHVRAPSADDTSRADKPQTELAKRYRRRSWGTIDNAGLINMQLHLPTSSPIPSTGGHDYFDQNHRPRSAQSNRDVQGSIPSAPSSTSSVRDAGHIENANPSSRGPSKPEESKRTSKPSPLSQPVDVDSKPSSPKPPQSTPSPKPTAAANPPPERLSELAKNDLKRPGKSRLRRAFSFGSASELRKASNKKEVIATERARRELLQEELGPEQAAIAEQQEASGLGESIYSSHHQGRIFNSSTDNLSVSSTASSASIMLRKMGKGMKRSTRSLVGLFRPKSIMSTSSTDAVITEPMAPQLSVVNIEAERKSGTVNADARDLPHGGTAFPKLESIGSSAAGHDDGGLDKGQSRKSIVGGDRERAEVLAAVRKGILKKTNSDTNVPTTSTKSFENSQAINNSDSPHSSVPSTPEDPTRSGNRRSDAIKIAGEDDYLSDSRFLGSEAKSAPVTPLSKSLVFSPRIQFHETWPSGEYDRRGDIATCNRLTPLLAQQIKEELNNFKMEMEVHETSKIYTHFL
ncbi:uncharacterized protein BO95DRAFT_101989 [Aspergillus brunneoviolaceus CBS 621.78]|uniref:Uncharacterized protein n=1 Tax=Aspergillus brunneoviolaceus CBS 621.78 TaxID=1450534 RepID=A0ACD1GBA1_9EURO|nr:hypothetical protein BO95DRAFT_101989 [Aspergillus brunneoviolaceus CBS 621.78]RAH46480.1 hypothetical protein BO95DRAFT_101989 [Aspergillus brunneoviolaceus CBS 621.78]